MTSLDDALRKYAERGDEGLLPAVVETVRHGHVSEHLHNLVARGSLATEESVVGYRHPNGFTKIRLLTLHDIGWTLRLHVWNANSSDRDIHSHRWNFASYVLSGCLIEQRYKSKVGAGQWTGFDCSPSAGGRYILDRPRSCDIELLTVDSYRAGDSYQRAADTLHMALAGSEIQPTMTLFVQGSTTRKTSTVVRPTSASTIGNDSFPRCSWQEVSGILKVALDFISNA